MTAHHVILELDDERDADRLRDAVSNAGEILVPTRHRSLGWAHPNLTKLRPRLVPPLVVPGYSAPGYPEDGAKLPPDVLERVAAARETVALLRRYGLSTGEISDQLALFRRVKRVVDVELPDPAEAP